MSEEFMWESYDSADAVINKILTFTGKDYTAGREELARLFDEELFNGNWDSSTDFGDAALPDLRLIQEDEYDQSMDNDDSRPDEDDQICYAAGHYVFFA